MAKSKKIKPVDYSKPLRNAKYERFSQEYSISGNATKAALKAKYSKKTARTQGSKLLTIVDIAWRISYLQKQIAAKCEVTADMIALEYKKLAFSNMQDLVDSKGKNIPLEKLPRDVAAAIQSVTDKGIKLHSKEKALDSLGRHIGFFEKDNEQQQIVLTKPLTESQLRERLDKIEKAGNGIDTGSIG